MTATMTAEGFSGKRTTHLVGITYRMLDYWARTGILRPSLVDAAGQGSRRSYAYRDLLELRIIRALLDGGVRLEDVRRHVEQMHAADEEQLRRGFLLFSTGTVEFLDDLAAWTGPTVAGMCALLPVAPLASEIDAEIAKAADQ